MRSQAMRASNIGSNGSRWNEITKPNRHMASEVNSAHVGRINSYGAAVSFSRSVERSQRRLALP